MLHNLYNISIIFNPSFIQYKFFASNYLTFWFPYKLLCIEIDCWTPMLVDIDDIIEYEFPGLSFNGIFCESPD